MVIEGVTAIALIHGLLQRQARDVFRSTRAILDQLRSNEELRVFWAIVIITLKIVLTYQRPERSVFDITSITHGVDVARSALVCWAILREQRTVTQATVQQRATLLPAPKSGGDEVSPLSSLPPKIRSPVDARQAPTPSLSATPRRQGSRALLPDSRDTVAGDESCVILGLDHVSVPPSRDSVRLDL